MNSKNKPHRVIITAKKDLIVYNKGFDYFKCAKNHAEVMRNKSKEAIYTLLHINRTFPINIILCTINEELT